MCTINGSYAILGEVKKIKIRPIIGFSQKSIENDIRFSSLLTLKYGSHLGFPKILVGVDEDGGLINSFRSSPTA